MSEAQPVSRGRNPLSDAAKLCGRMADFLERERSQFADDSASGWLVVLDPPEVAELVEALRLVEKILRGTEARP